MREATADSVRASSPGLLRWLSLSVFCGAILLGTARRSVAATISVTASFDSGPGTLRNAIATSQSGDTLDCTPIAGLTIAVASPLTISNKSLTIVSNAAPLHIDGAGINQVFKIQQGAAYAVTLSNLSVQNGKVQGANGTDASVAANATNGLPAKGAGIYCSGGALTLNNCTISGNKAIGGNGGSANASFPISGSGGAAQGGGIFCTGTTLTLTSCALSNNTATGGKSGTPGPSGGGYYGGSASGGGLFCDTAPVIAGTSFKTNKALGGAGGSGAGIDRASGGWGGNARGGGLYLSPPAATTTTISASTFSGNSAQGGMSGSSGDALSVFAAGADGARGGGAWGGGVFSLDGSLNLSTVTLSGNSATGGAGGNGGAGGLRGAGGGSQPDPFALAGGRAYGGGLAVLSGSLSLASTMVSANVCASGDGGIGGSGGAGNATGGGGAGGWGGWAGIARGGGIFSLAPATISSSTISGNTLTGGNGGTGGAGGSATSIGTGGKGAPSGYGGSTCGAGIYAGTNANLSVSATSIVSNSAIAGSAGVGGQGGNAAGGNYSGGNGGANRAGGNAIGGGIFLKQGSLALSQSTITLNTLTAGSAGAGGGGGNGSGSSSSGRGGYDVYGMYHGGSAAGAGISVSGTASLTQSTISQNSAAGGKGGDGGSGGGGAIPGAPGRGSVGGTAAGGGIWGYFVSGPSTIDNCSISQNSVSSGAGGNGANAQSGSGANLSGANGGPAESAAGGGIWVSGSLSIIHGSTIANNVATGSHGGSAGNGGANSAGNGGSGGNGGDGGPAAGAGVCLSSGNQTLSDAIVTGNMGTGGAGAAGGSGGSGGATGNGGSGGMGGAGGTAQGGGIDSAGALTISTTTIASNSNASGAGGNGGAGGDGLSGGAGGAAGASSAAGGGIENASTGALTLRDSTLSANVNSTSIGATGGKGGNGSVSGGAGGSGTGGSVSGGGIDSSGMLSVINSTLSGNSNSSSVASSGGAGGAGPSGAGNGGDGATTTVSAGGIAQNSSSTAQIDNSTIVFNVCNDSLGGNGGAAGSGPGGNAGAPGANFAGQGGGAALQGSGQVTLASSIVARNIAAQAADVSGLVDGTSNHNLIGDGTQLLGISNGLNANQIGTALATIDPKLGALQNNGGPTQTRLLQFGSPAIAAGSNPHALVTDQRGAGFPRLLGANADVGATAFDSAPPVAKVNATDVNTPAASYLFSVLFSDNFGVDVAGVGTGNILVSGPNGFSQVATFVSVSPGVSGPAFTVTYMITPPGGIWTPAASGAYSIAMLANQIKDNTGNFVSAGVIGGFNVSIIATPPVFSSAPTATPNPALPAQPIQFAANVNGVAPLAFAWDFGDGGAGSGASIAHAFAVPGTYNVTVTVIDGNGLSIAAALAVIVSDVNGDSDGDGFSNDVEIALGSDPLDAKSTPISTANAGVPVSTSALKVKQLRIQLNFAGTNQDTIQMSVQLPLSKIGSPSQMVIVDVGHVIKAFQLDSRGKANTSIGKTGSLNDTLRMSKRGAMTLKLARGNFQPPLSSDGDPMRNLTGAQGNSKTRTLKVSVYFNQTRYSADVTAAYSAAKGKFGK